MSKEPICWHEECLRNLRGFVERKREEVKRAEAELERLETQLSQYEYQIETAKREGKDSFDKERFAIRRRVE